MIQDAPHISKAAFPESVFVLFAGVLSGRHIGISYTILVVFEEIVCDGLVLNLHDGVHDFRFFLLRVRIVVDVISNPIQPANDVYRPLLSECNIRFV